MVGSQTVLSILDEAAAALGGWTALKSISCVHSDSEGQDWEPWQAYDIGGTLDVSTFRTATDLDLGAGASRVEMDAEVVERHGRFGPAPYLRITPTISWSWNLEGRPFTHDREVVVQRTVHEAAAEQG